LKEQAKKDDLANIGKDEEKKEEEKA